MSNPFTATNERSGSVSSHPFALHGETANQRPLNPFDTDVKMVKDQFQQQSRPSHPVGNESEATKEQCQQQKRPLNPFDIEIEQSPVPNTFAGQADEVMSAPLLKETTGVRPRTWCIIGVIIVCIVCVCAGVGLLLRAEAKSVVDDGCSYTDYRLRPAATPTKYTIQWKPRFQAPFTFSGSTLIQAQMNFDSQACVQLHSQGLTFDKVQVATLAGARGQLTLQDVTWFVNPDPQTERIVVRLPQTLSAGSPFTLYFEFHAGIRKDMTGLYLSTYQDDAGRTVNIVCSQFEPTYARRAFPCFDEPAYKAPFDVVLQHIPLAYTALSNMPVKSSSANPDGTKDYAYATSPRMSTYLLAALAAPLTSVSGSAGSRNVQVSVYAVNKGNNAQRLSYALRTAQTVLNYFESVFRIPYPLAKLDMVAIPDFAFGAMENWGLVMYRETLLLTSPSSSMNELQLVASVIAHEVAHQWFGNLVTMEWWNSLFLNEGDATLWQYLATDAVYPQYQYSRQFATTEMTTAMRSTWFGRSRQLVSTVSNSAEIEAQFDDVSYAMGASILYMLKAQLDATKPGAYSAGMTAYFKQFSYTNTNPPAFWQSLAIASGMKDLGAYMSQYTSQVGYPLLTVSWINADGATTGVGGLQVSQQRHFLSPFCRARASPSETAYTWWIPISLYGEHPAPGSGVLIAQQAAAIQGGFTSAVWATTIGSPGTTATYSIVRDGFVKLNINSTGFYRVNYPLNIWNALRSSIQQQLTAGSNRPTTPADRGNLLDDLFTLAYGQVAQPNGLNMAFFLRFASFLQYEKMYEPWVAAFSALGRLQQLLVNDNGAPAACYAKLSKYAQGLVTPLFQSLGFNGDQSGLNTILRSSVISLGSSFNVSSIVSGCNSLFNAGPTKIPANIQQAVLSSAIRWAPTASQYYTVRNMLVSTSDAALRRRYAKALAASSDVALLRALLNDCINPSVIRSQDTTMIIAAIASNPVGRGPAWQFVKNNWALLQSRYGDGGGGLFASLVFGISSNFQSANMYNDVSTFFAGKHLGSASLRLMQALETIETNIGWVQSDLSNTCRFF